MEFRFIDPAADFSNGIEVLRIYHQDFFARGEELLALTDEIRAFGMNADRAHACVALHCHFLRANRLHHRDEECALFPLLVHASPFVDGMIERLTLDHEEIEEAWDALAALLARPEQIGDADMLTSRARTFEQSLRLHLEREEADFLGRVETLLTQREQAQAGRTMALLRRRREHSDRDA